MRASRLCVVLLGLLGVVLVPPVHAADCVCEDAVQAGKYTGYVLSQNACPQLSGATQTCHTVPRPQTDPQRLINVGQPHATPPVPPSVPVRYRKVVNKLVVEMTPAEKAQVDASLTAGTDLLTSYTTEQQDPALCVLTVLSEISQALATSQDTAQAADTAAKDAITQEIATGAFNKTLLTALAHDYYARLAQDRTNIYLWLDKIARCLRAQIGLR